MFLWVPGKVPAMEKGQWAVGYTPKGQNMKEFGTFLSSFKNRKLSVLSQRDLCVVVLTLMMQRTVSTVVVVVV